MVASVIENVLILAKTYPSPSARYAETSCVAGINANGQMRRLFPVPFRLMENSQQFQKWQWVNARIYPSNNDKRIESHKIYTDTIQSGEIIPTKQDWHMRRTWINQIPASDENGETLYLVKPSKITRLEILPEKSSEWTSLELDKLLQQQNQGDLFKEEPRSIRQLKKLPYRFYYHYLIKTPSGEISVKHKIVDWEAGALYWNCFRDHGKYWERPFRQKLEIVLPSHDLMFLLGNIHRFPDQWLIISLIYPPKIRQPSLF